MNEKDMTPPEFGINLFFTIQNCSLPRHNLESPEFLTSMFEQNSGILVFLKDCRIMTVHQPELYLSSWSELWENTCKCDHQAETFKMKQKLVEIVKKKSQFQNLKESVVYQAPRCSNCNSKMKFIKRQDESYMSCQKIKVLTTMKTGHSKDEFSQKGELTLLLDQNYISSLNVGDNVDMCAYYTV